MKRVTVFACLLLMLLGLAPALARASSLQAKVVEILDGNTMVVINVNRRIKVVLKGSDAPEEEQPLADLARQHLADLILGKEVLVDYTELGRDSHLVAKVYWNEMDVGQQMIRDGVAWYDRTYERDLTQLERQLYAESEQAARSERRGIWQEAAPVAPWQFRLARDAKASQSASSSVASNAQTGPAKTTAPATQRNARGLRSGELGSTKPIRWQRLAPPGEYFSVLMPDEGQQFTSKIPSPSGMQLETEFLIVRYNGVGYMMMWATNTDRKHYTADTVFENTAAGFKAGLRQLVKRYGEGYACEVSYDKDISMGQYAGRQYSISSCAVPGVLRMFYKVSGPKIKMYLAATMLGIEGNPVVDHFFDSFKITAERNPDAPAENQSGSR